MVIAIQKTYLFICESKGELTVEAAPRFDNVLTSLFDDKAIVSSTVSTSSSPWAIYVHCTRDLNDDERELIQTKIKEWKPETSL